MQTSRTRVVVIGSGAGGKTAAQELARKGYDVVVVEENRVGGECQYVACVPSKILLMAGQAGLSWADALAAREEAVDGRDDASSVESLTEDGVQLVRGRARIAAAGRVSVDGGPDLVADLVVLATGSAPARPPIDGLDGVPTWTSDEALSAMELPWSMIVLGGGAVGCELALAFASLGSSVTLVESAPGLLGREEPFVGEAVGEGLRAAGVRVLTGVSAKRATPSGAGVVLHLDDGTELAAERLLLAGGRKARVDDLGLDAIGVAPGDDGRLAVDPRCRVLSTGGEALDWLFAVGDVTPDSSYTHSANHQARILAAHVTGSGRDADYRGTPRVVFTTPAVWCTGTTRSEAGDDVRYAEFDLAEVERGSLLNLVGKRAGRPPVSGRVSLLVDAGGVLIGAAAVGPDVDGWAAELGLAVHRGLTVQDLLDVQHGFLTWPETLAALLPLVAGPT